MTHPLLKLLPQAIRSSVYHRIFIRKEERNFELFRNATLDYCSAVKMDLFPSDVSHRHIAYTGFYELPLTRKITRLAKEGGLMVDVGANFGYFSLLWAGTSASNKVIAIEASPRVFPYYQENIKKNALGSQVEMHNLAAGAEPGRLSFSLGPAEQTGWGGFGSADIGGEVVEVKVVKLDELIPPDVEISVLKIDVEGADTLVLKGARRLLEQKRIHHIFFEENDRRMQLLGIDRADAVNFLHSVGYSLESFGQPGEYHAFPK